MPLESRSVVSIESVEPLADVGLHHQPIDDHLDRVLLFLSRSIFSRSSLDLAVDPDAREALFDDLLEELRVLALAAADHRREHLQARPFRELHDLIDDLLGALRADFAPAVVTVRLADAREKQTQIIVDLGDRTDRRARIARGRLLIDRDRRREPLDVVDVGLLHLPEKLARVRRERLDVAALTFGVDRVERERRLAATRRARDHDEPVARQGQVDVLEVMLARALDDNRIKARHCRLGLHVFLDRIELLFVALARLRWAALGIKPQWGASRGCPGGPDIRRPRPA